MRKRQCRAPRSIGLIALGRVKDMASSSSSSPSSYYNGWRKKKKIKTKMKSSSSYRLDCSSWTSPTLTSQQPPIELLLLLKLMIISLLLCTNIATAEKNKHCKLPFFVLLTQLHNVLFMFCDHRSMHSILYILDGSR